MIDSLPVRAVFAGVLFGAWPLLMNRSGLSGNVSSLVLAMVMFWCFLPFSVSGIGEIFASDTRLVFAVVASVLGGIGILILNNIIAKTTPQTISPLLVLLFVAQIAVPSIYHIIMAGGLTATKGVGVVFAIIAVILLSL